MTRLLVVGEALVDIVRKPWGDVPIPGGSGANAARAMARLGGEVEIATGLARDEYGVLLDKTLGADHVSWASDPWVLERTPIATATVDDAGAASYDFDVTWDLDEVSQGDWSAIHVTSWSVTLPPGRAKALAVVDAAPDTTVVYDLNLRPSVTGLGPEMLASVEAMASRSHVVKASVEDLAHLYPDASEEEAAHALMDIGAREVVVTRGQDGSAWWSNPRECVEVPAVEAEVVDTIGAGDTFSAAFLIALAERDDLDNHGVHDGVRREVLEFAGRAAAVTVTREGCNPPTRIEV